MRDKDRTKERSVGGSVPTRPQTDEKDTVLIVDDNPTNLSVLFDYLRGFGFKVLIAENGESALKRANYASPDIILLDVMMPGMDGFETCRRLKESQDTREIPVVFMTALSDTVDKVKGFEFGAVDYITKPLQQEEVLARIRTHLTIRNLQRRLEQQIVERDELIAELDAFAHTVAHDLKNPLHIVIGFAELLVQDHATMPLEGIGEFSRSIFQTGCKMDNIIEELMLLAGVRKGEVRIAPLDMANIVAEARRRLVDMIEAHQAEIVAPDTWPVALGYGPWVEEVWVNYLSNAIKYGGRPPLVELGFSIGDLGLQVAESPAREAGHLRREQSESEIIRFWARDNGPGLTPEEQARLFTPFSRLEQVRAEGHGLGLSIVRRIVEKLGGHVGVESTVGQGSLFFFTLPGAAD